MADENLPWLVFPPAVDLSNTVIATPAGPRDLLESEEELAAGDSYVRFEAAVARSAIELASRGEDRLSVCGAPSCGMLYLREHPRQVWCSKACGNRARVARHAARQRRA